MKGDLTVLLEPKPKKCVRIASQHLEGSDTNNVIRKAPKPKGPNWSSPVSGSSNMKTNIIIPKRRFNGYIDLANDVSLNLNLSLI